MLVGFGLLLEKTVGFGGPNSCMSVSCLSVLLRAFSSIARVVLLAMLSLCMTQVHAATVRDVSVHREGAEIRIVFDLDAPVKHTIMNLTGPDRVVIDIASSTLKARLGAVPL